MFWRVSPLALALCVACGDRAATSKQPPTSGFVVAEPRCSEHLLPEAPKIVEGAHRPELNACGYLLVSTTDGYHLYPPDFNSPAEVLPFHTGTVKFSADGSQLAYGQTSGPDTYHLVQRNLSSGIESKIPLQADPASPGHFPSQSASYGFLTLEDGSSRLWLCDGKELSVFGSDLTLPMDRRQRVLIDTLDHCRRPAAGATFLGRSGGVGLMKETAYVVDMRAERVHEIEVGEKLQRGVRADQIDLRLEGALLFHTALHYAPADHHAVPGGHIVTETGSDIYDTRTGEQLARAVKPTFEGGAVNLEDRAFVVHAGRVRTLKGLRGYVGLSASAGFFHQLDGAVDSLLFIDLKTSERFPLFNEPVSGVVVSPDQLRAAFAVRGCAKQAADCAQNGTRIFRWSKRAAATLVFQYPGYARVTWLGDNGDLLVVVRTQDYPNPKHVTLLLHESGETSTIDANVLSIPSTDAPVIWELVSEDPDGESGRSLVIYEPKTQTMTRIAEGVVSAGPLEPALQLDASKRRGVASVHVLRDGQPQLAVWMGPVAPH